MILGNLAFSDQDKIIVADFLIQTENPSFKNLGKGFAEFIAVKLASSGDILVVDRAERNKALKKLEINLTGIMNEPIQFLLGEQLGAQYLVRGTIVDRENLEVTVELLDIHKRTIIFTTQVHASPGAYEYIAAAIAGRILQHLELSKTETTAENENPPEEFPEEAAKRFSDAVDDLDKKDTESAARNLAEASRLDPENEAIKTYLASLMVNTAKFNFLSNHYLPKNNPAYLGIIHADEISASAIINSPYIAGIIQGSSEVSALVSMGFCFPVGDRFGIGLETLTPSMMSNSVWDEDTSFNALLSYTSWGGIASFGWTVTDHISLGTSLSVFYQYKHSYLDSPATGIVELNNKFTTFALTAGMVFRNKDDSFLYDLLIGYPFVSLFYAYLENETSDDISSPVSVNNTLTWAFNDRTLFLIFKQLNGITLSRFNYVTELLAAVEVWPADWLSFQLSAEVSASLFEGRFQGGFGGKAGITLRIPGTGWGGWDFEFTVAYRKRPSSIAVKMFYDDFILSLSISKSGSFIIR